VLLVLIGFPALYWVNTFTPWSLGLFWSGNRDWWPGFPLSTGALHWGTTLAVLYFVRCAGGTPRDIGLKANLAGVLLMLGLLLALGGAMVALRPWCAAPYDQAPAAFPAIMYPATTLEAALWVFAAVSAGFCEELIYRGFAIRVLVGRGMRTWLAVVLASLSFVMIHGAAGLIMLPMLFLVGVVYSGIFLWRKSLTLGILLHAVFDLFAVWAVRVE
jgi:membrane protease YdiL (CAAX protease family)